MEEDISEDASTQASATEKFLEFASAVTAIQDRLSTVNSSSHCRPVPPYLTAKIAEGLALVFEKDPNNPQHWQALMSYIQLGLMIAQENTETEGPKNG